MTQPPNGPGEHPDEYPHVPDQGFGQQPQQPGPPPYPGQQQDPYSQGGFPPQQPGYGAGGFPPPPQGGYPPPGFGGYGQPQFGSAPFSVGDAFSWAWNKFTKNAVPLIVAMLAYIAIVGAVIVVGYLLIAAIVLGASTTDAGITTLTTGGSIGVVISTALLILVVAFVGYVLQAAFYSGLLDIADGRQVEIGSFFKPRNAREVVIAAVIISVVAGVVGMIPFLGGIASIVIGFLTMFAIPVIVDRGLPAVDGIKEGFAIVQRDLGNAVIMYLLAGLIGVVGACLCGVGLLVAGPLSALLIVYTYRRLSGGQVAPLTP